MKKISHVLLFLLALNFIGIGSPALAIDSEQELFLISQKAFDDGFYDVALRYLEQFLNTYPNSSRIIQAKLLFGQCYFFQNQYLKAFDIFQELLAFNEYKDVTLFWLGETYFKGSDFNEARKKYKQLIQIYKDSSYVPQAYYAIAWTYFEQNEYKEGKKYLLEFLRKFPTHQLTEDVVFKLGEGEYNSKEYETAIQYFHNYVTRFPQSTRHAETYFYMGESYFYLGDYLPAITYYAKSADLAFDPKIAIMAKVGMGWCYIKLRKFDLAQKALLQARELAETKKILLEDVYLGLASLFTETNELTKAKENYEKIIKLFPTSQHLPESLLGVANVNYISKNYQDAIQNYQKIIQEYSTDPSESSNIEKAYYGLAWTYLKSGEIDRAIENFEKIMNKTTSKTVKISALTQIGDAYQENNNLQKAIDVYDRILKEYPDSLYTDYVQFRQGIALLKLNQIEAATISFQALKTNFPKSKYLSDVQYYLGLAYFKLEDWGQSIQFLDDYLNSSENLSFSAEANYMLALSNFHLNDFTKAKQFFQKILDSTHTHETLLKISEYYLAKCFYKLGHTNEGLRRFSLIVDKYPNSKVAQDSLLAIADHDLEKQNFKKAIKHYNKFVEMYPGSENIALAYFEIGQAYQSLQKPQNALSFYKRVTPLEDNKEVYAKAQLAIAEIFSKEHEIETSLEMYQSIINTVPEFRRDAYVKMANIYKKINQFENSLKMYEHALACDKALSSISSAEIQFLTGDTYELLNQSQKATEVYFKVPYLYPDATDWIIKAYLRIGRIFEKTEKWQNAIQIYKKIKDFDVAESIYAQERIDWITLNNKNSL